MEGGGKGGRVFKETSFSEKVLDCFRRPACRICGIYTLFDVPNPANSSIVSGLCVTCYTLITYISFKSKLHLFTRRMSNLPEQGWYLRAQIRRERKYFLHARTKKLRIMTSSVGKKGYVDICST